MTPRERDERKLVRIERIKRRFHRLRELSIREAQSFRHDPRRDKRATRLMCQAERLMELRTLRFKAHIAKHGRMP